MKRVSLIDSGVWVRFRFPGLQAGETLQFGFVDREMPGVHAGHLAHGILAPGSIPLIDQKTGVMKLGLRARRQEMLGRKEPMPPDLEALLKSRQKIPSWKSDTKWQDLLVVTEGDEMRLSLDGKLMVRHGSEGLAHPVKRWFSFLVSRTVWIDDVKIWRVR